MNKEDPYRDQAERLRKRIEKMNEDVQSDSSLPPRSDMHRNKKKKTKLKLKYPIIRMLVLFFILLPITIFSIYSSLENKKHGGTEKTSISSETINLDKEKKEKETGTKASDKTNNGGSGLNEQNGTSDDTSKTSNNQLQHNGTNNQTNETNQINSSSEKNTDKNGQPDSSANQSEPQKVIYHTVQQEETLFRISMKYFHSNTGIDIIKKANNIMGNEINAGQVLKIPLDN